MLLSIREEAIAVIIQQGPAAKFKLMLKDKENRCSGALIVRKKAGEEGS